MRHGLEEEQLMGKTTLAISLLIGLTTVGCGGSSGSGGSGGAQAGMGGAGGVGGAGAGGSTGAGSGGATGAGGGAGSGAGGALAACGNSTDPSTGDSCNTVDATGLCVTPTTGTGPAPTAGGGTIVAGIYDLTSITDYGPNASNDQGSKRDTLSFTANGNSWTLTTTQVSGTAVQRQSGPVTISSTQATFAPTCPPPGDGGNNGGTVGFNADATTFTLIEDRGGGNTRVSIYAKR
jgi:hypothetical protein